MHLTKHHGLGNDFLVLLDADGSQPLDADRVRALCDRHRGIGADGLIRAIPTAHRADASGADAAGTDDDSPGGASADANNASEAGADADSPGDAATGVDTDRPGGADPVVAIMQLVNADGSPAEMSGNGIRCLAQALVMAGWVGHGGTTGLRLPIRTDAGVRTVTVHEPVDAVTQISSVDMGPARVVGDAPEWSGGPVRRALLVDVGNPHLVLDLAPGHEVAARHDTGDVRLVELGERVNAKLPDGANVHLLAAVPSSDGPGGERGAIVIRTHERGVGPTQACGTGACAAAAAARHWGLAGDHVVVRMPGGDAAVTLTGPADRGGEAGQPEHLHRAEQAELRGPATWIADIEVPASPEVGP